MIFIRATRYPRDVESPDYLVNLEHVIAIEEPAPSVSIGGVFLITTSAQQSGDGPMRLAKYYLPGFTLETLVATLSDALTRNAPLEIIGKPLGS